MKQRMLVLMSLMLLVTHCVHASSLGSGGSGVVLVPPAGLGVLTPSGSPVEQLVRKDAVPPPPEAMLIMMRAGSERRDDLKDAHRDTVVAWMLTFDIDLDYYLPATTNLNRQMVDEWRMEYMEDQAVVVTATSGDTVPY